MLTFVYFFFLLYYSYTIHICSLVSIISYLLNFFKANEVSAEAEAKGQEKNREARIAMEEKNQIGLLEVNSHAKINAKNKEKNQEKNQENEKANEKEKNKETLSVSTKASVELLLLMKTKANENLKAASMHLAESQKWETVSIQMNSDYNDYLRLADRTQERIDSGWWPEYTLLR